MKKTIIASLLTISVLGFAKTEEPKLENKTIKGEERALVAKKNFKDEKAIKKVELRSKEIDPHTTCVIGFAYNVWTHGGNFLEAAAIADQICP